MNSLLLTLATMTVAAPPAPPAAPPTTATSPLLFVRVLAPNGTRVVFHPGTPSARAYDAPAEVGLRPGFAYRVELANVPNLAGARLFPSLEVRGMLNVPLAQALRHPVPISFSDEELRRVAQKGSMITKVYYLEDPSQSAPVQTTPNSPLVFEVPADTDPMQEARERGRPMVVVRLGEIEPPAAELARLAVPNTILFPGEQRLIAPPTPPYLPWMHWPVFDPVIGAKRGDEECLPDGGDVGPRIGIGPDGKIGGLDASDSAIEYSTESGKRKVAVSNRICLLVPRYAATRQELAPAGVDSKFATNAALGRKGFQEYQNRIPPGKADNSIILAGTTGRQGPSGMQSKLALHGFENLKNVRMTAMIEGIKVVGSIKEPEEITAYPLCEPISLFKWAEPKEAQIGDVVTFYLRFHNHTKQFVENLVVSDSLTSRLEYVAGTARSDREATLTIQPNEVGSSILRWEIGGKLPPGQSGIVAFQARVR